MMYIYFLTGMAVRCVTIARQIEGKIDNTELCFNGKMNENINDCLHLAKELINKTIFLNYY